MRRTAQEEKEAHGMQPRMAYMVSLEDGEIVKMTAEGFESTGMFIMDMDGTWVPMGFVRGVTPASANA